MKNKQSFSSNRTLLIVVLTIFAMIVVFFVMSRSSSSLVSPAVKQVKTQPSTQPVTPAYNPPKEIKYDSSTDLQKELDSIDPKVLDGDFE